MIIYITNDSVGTRIDIAIAGISGISRARIQNLIHAGCVTIGGDVIQSASAKIAEPCSVMIDTSYSRFDPNNVAIAENIELNIVYEDDDLLILDKESGMVVHPAPGHRSGTIVNALLWKYKDSDVERNGIVHRLDKDTSGLMIVAKTNTAHAKLSEYFSGDRRITKKYKCFTFGVPAIKNSKIETFITRDHHNRQKYTVSESRGKRSITNYESLKTIYVTSTKAISLIECELITGRTHQIRVHMRHLNCPIIGDPMYGKSKIELIYPDIVKTFKRTALHSYYLEFPHPISKNLMSFESKLPDDLMDLYKLFV